MSSITILKGEPVPVANVFCFGRTYRAHAKELGNPVPKEPLLFLKSSHSVRGLAPEPLAFASETFHHEAEVVVLVGDSISLGTKPTWDAIEAVGLGLDLTRRGVQSGLKERGHPWTISKSFAGSAIVSPMTPRHELTELDAIEFSLEVDGELRQRGSTAQLTHSVPALLARLAEMTALGRGDLIFTGTPKGVGEIRQGDRFTLESPTLGRHHGTL